MSLRQKRCCSCSDFAFEGGKGSVCVCLVFAAMKAMFSCRIRPGETKRGPMCQRECMCKMERMCQGKYMCQRECVSERV